MKTISFPLMFALPSTKYDLYAQHWPAHTKISLSFGQRFFPIMLSNNHNNNYNFYRIHLSMSACLCMADIVYLSISIVCVVCVCSCAVETSY